MTRTWMAWPLCSSRIARPSPLLRAIPPLCLASVLWSSWVLHLDFSLRIEATGSQVPCTSLRRAHATLTPDTICSEPKYPADFSQWSQKPLVLISLCSRFRRLIDDSFSFVSLVLTLPESSPDFPTMLMTIALNNSHLRWFEACSLVADSGGPSAIFSIAFYSTLKDSDFLQNPTSLVPQRTCT